MPEADTEDKLNENLMGANANTKGMVGFKNAVDRWQLMPPGNARETAKQILLDSMHKNLAVQLEIEFKQDFVDRHRIPNY